jgi:hypothetical protein
MSTARYLQAHPSSVSRAQPLPGYFSTSVLMDTYVPAVCLPPDLSRVVEEIEESESSGPHNRIIGLREVDGVQSSLPAVSEAHLRQVAIEVPHQCEGWQPPASAVADER